MIEDYINNGKEESSLEFNNLFSYICKDCDITFASTNKKQSNCIYCGSDNISFTKNHDFSNYLIIPFNLKLDEVVKIYKKRVLLNPLIPFKFKTKNAINSIGRVYFPVCLINANYMGKIAYLAGDKNKIVKNNQKLTELKKYSVKSDVNFDYDKILLNSFSKINEKAFSKVFTFDYSKAKKLDEEYLKKSFIINPNLSEKEIMDIAKERIINNSLSIVRKSIKHELKKIEENDTNIKFEDIYKLLVPIYFINLRYRNKDYPFLINGINNEVYYKLPIGIIETIISTVLIFGIIFLLGYWLATIL